MKFQAVHVLWFFLGLVLFISVLGALEITNNQLNNFVFSPGVKSVNCAKHCNYDKTCSPMCQTECKCRGIPVACEWPKTMTGNAVDLSRCNPFKTSVESTPEWCRNNCDYYGPCRTNCLKCKCRSDRNVGCQFPRNNFNQPITRACDLAKYFYYY